MKFWIITALPGIYRSFLEEGLIGKARQKGLLSIEVIDLRDFGVGPQRKIDDSPYGGGPGMLLRIEPVHAALESVPDKNALRVLLSPKGEKLNQGLCKKLSGFASLVLVCPRYEGIDQRIEDYVDMEISLGDFILMGGDLAAMALIESAGRLIPGVVGNPQTLVSESFESGLLECAQYTRPYDYLGKTPPEKLLSGNHAEISNWKRKSSEAETASKRPDLLKPFLNTTFKDHE